MCIALIAASVTIRGRLNKNAMVYMYWGADKSLARPGRKEAALVENVMGEEWIDLARLRAGGGLL